MQWPLCYNILIDQGSSISFAFFRDTMSSGGEPPTSQAFTPFWIAGPGSPSAPVVGNPVANPVPTSDLGTLGAGGVSSAVPPTMSQDITTMANAVPHDDFTNGLPEAPPQPPPPPPPPSQPQAQPQPQQPGVPAGEQKVHSLVQMEVRIFSAILF